jgi:hypothetical protein
MLQYNDMEYKYHCQIILPAEEVNPLLFLGLSETESLGTVPANKPIMLAPDDK